MACPWGWSVNLAELFADVIDPPPQPGEPTPEETRRETLAREAADKLRQHPELRRAAQIEADGDGCLVAVAVRMPRFCTTRGSMATPPCAGVSSAYLGTSCMSMKGDLPGFSKRCCGYIGSYQ